MSVTKINGWDFDVLDEVVKTPLRLPRSSAEGDVCLKKKTLEHNGLDGDLELMTSKVSDSVEGWFINVLDEVLESPLRFPRNAGKEDSKISLERKSLIQKELDISKISLERKSLIQKELDIISDPSTEDTEIFSALDGLFSNFTSESHFKEFMSQLMTRMILDSSNASKICKYMYLLHSSKINKFILQTFDEVMRDTLNDLGELVYCYGYFGLKSFAMYFMAGVHFMRNFASPPDDFSRSKLLDITELLRLSPLKVDVLKTFCLLLLRYYHYCYTYDDDKNDSKPRNSDWSRFKALQALVATQVSVDRLKKDVAVFVSLVTKPSQLEDHGCIYYIQSVLSKSDYEDLIPSFIIWVPSSHEEYFQNTFGSSRYLHYK